VGGGEVERPPAGRDSSLHPFVCPNIRLLLRFSYIKSFN
jgi:hypothetical protein